MIGAMPAVAVRHERRKGQEKRSKRPSQLYIGGHWLPPTSPSPTPSPNGPHMDSYDRLPEYYLCGKVSALQIIVGSILLGAIVLIVGLVQLVPNAADADHRYIFLGAGTGLLVLGLIVTGVRCFCIHCSREARAFHESRRHHHTTAGATQQHHHHHHHHIITGAGGGGGGAVHEIRVGGAGGLTAAAAVVAATTAGTVVPHSALDAAAAVSSLEVMVARRDTQTTTSSPSELDSLIGNQSTIDKEDI